MDWPKSPISFSDTQQEQLQTRFISKRAIALSSGQLTTLCKWIWQCKRRICQAKDGAHIQFENLEQNLGDDFQILLDG